MRNETIERLIQDRVWAKEINGKFYPMIAQDMFKRSFDTMDNAVKHGEELKLKTLKYMVYSFYGWGSEYAGIKADAPKNN